MVWASPPSGPTRSGGAPDRQGQGSLSLFLRAPVPGQVGGLGAMIKAIGGARDSMTTPYAGGVTLSERPTPKGTGATPDNYDRRRWGLR